MKQAALGLILLSLFTNCKQSNSYSLDAPTTPSDSTTLYFPLKTNSRYQFNNKELALDTSMNVWFSESLFTFSEPVLKTYSGENDVYRFTYLRSFDNPIVIRLTEENEGKAVLSKILNYTNDGKYELRQNHKKAIGEKQWESFTSSLDGAEFWDLDPMTNPREWHSDGALWIMEAVKDGKYRFVVRQTPSDKFRKACELLFQIADIKLEKNDIY